MPLLAVQVEDFRCIRRADLQLDSKLTLITGPNGAGKTSLLEAIFFLGRGRSFRSRQVERVIRSGASGLTVIGHLAGEVRPLVIGIHARPGNMDARIGGKEIGSLAELALAFPVQVIDPNLHKLIEEGPVTRRRSMDWGVFHVEPGFAREWQRYQRALKQRNAALRAAQAAATTRAWDGELSNSGELLTAARERYVEQLGPWVERIAHSLIGGEITLSLARGWPAGSSLPEALADAWSRDTRLGVTTIGPHRADLRLRMEGHLARDRVSRGQQKLLAAAIVIAQLHCLRRQTGRSGTLLLDDPAAELDVGRLQALMDQIADLDTQLIVTATSPRVEGLARPGSVFHVEQGQFDPDAIMLRR